MSKTTVEHPAAAEEAKDILRGAIPRAAATLVEMLGAKDERVRLRAAEAILNRAGVTEASRVNPGWASRSVGGVE